MHLEPPVALFVDNHDPFEAQRPLATIRGGVNSLMAEILEDHIQLHIMHPDARTESPEQLTEDLIALVRAYLK